MYEYRKKIVLLLVAAIWLFGITEGIDRWQEHRSYGTLPQEEVLNISEYTLQYIEKTFKLYELNEKYVLLDFWGSHCAGCFKTFPELQRLHEKHQNDSNLAIISVFLMDDKRNENWEKGIDMVKQRGYNFKVCATNYENPLLEYTGIDGVPTVLILDQSRNVIFRGSLNFAKRKLETLLYE